MAMDARDDSRRSCTPVLDDDHEMADPDDLGSTVTLEKVAAAKKYIENHYKIQMKQVEERKKRSFLHIP